MRASRAAVARCAPFGLFLAVLALGSMLDAPWIVLVRGLIVALALAWFWRDYGELRSAPPVDPSTWLLTAAVGLAVFVLWIWLDHDWVVTGRSPGFDPRLSDGNVHWPAALVRLAGFALVVPVMEELFWRSFLLRWLERSDFLAVAPRSVSRRSLLITTALFALEHSQWLAGAIAGIAYAALYMRSGNLWVPIAAHALTNAALGVWIIATGNWHFW